MKTHLLSGCCMAAALLFAGCSKTAETTQNYKNALDTYYSAHPSCLWTTSQKFPVQVAASNQEQSAPYDALVDQGLLARTTTEKQIIIVSKQEQNYDITNQGRSFWTPDATQPGYGNFCYGHRNVATIDSATANNGQPGARTVVTFHWSFSGAPPWAQAAETQNAFPNVRTDLAGNGVSSKTLVDTRGGWQVQ